MGASTHPCIFPIVWIKTYYAHKNQTEQEIEPTLRLLNAENAVENNYLSPGLTIPLLNKEISQNQIKQFDEELRKDCDATGNTQKCISTYNKWRNLSYRQGGLDINDTSFENFAALMYQQEASVGWATRCPRSSIKYT